MKLISLGLDGASFELLNPWLEGGELPNLKKIREKGVWGDMESCLPPVSCPNWKCYSTGKNPGKLGIYWWENVDFKKRRVHCPDYRSKSLEIWDYLNQAGEKVAIINMPLTYPPKKVDGFISSGGPSARDENFAYPPDWESELIRRGYRVHPRRSISNREVCRELHGEIMGMIKGRFRLAMDFAREEDIEFIHLTIFYINVLQHFLWGEDLLKEAWKVIDEKIGNLMSLAENDEWNLIIFSDHGSNHIKEIFNINAWLKKEGLLKVSRTFLTQALYRLGLSRRKIIELSEKLGIKRLLRKIVPEGAVDRIPSKAGGLSREAKTEMVNWEESFALGLGQGCLYLDTEKMEAREKLIDELENLRNSTSGRAPVRKVFRREEIYSGNYLNIAPDLVLDQEHNVHISGNLAEENIFESPGKWKGENKKTGLFLAYGPVIKENKKIANVNILDIAPTILHLFNRPIPQELDGKVLKEVFKGSSESFKRPIKHIKIGQREKQRLKQKIKNLKADRNI